MKLSLKKAEVEYFPHFLPLEIANSYFSVLKNSIVWQSRKIKIFGRFVDQPRLMAWHGDENKKYKYSGTVFDPQPWTQDLLDIKNKIESVCDLSFNSVLLNLYRNGQDSMGWHSDDEKELGRDPIIASLSLGQERRFIFRDKKDHENKRELVLKHGSLLIMSGKTQEYYHHSVPKQLKINEPRINLTFRRILD